MCWCLRCVEFTAKAEQFFIIQTLALMSPSMRDSVIRCRTRSGENVYILRVIKTSARAPIAFTPLNFSSLLLFIIVMCTEMGGRKAGRRGRFIVIENWIDRIYVFTDEIFGDIVHNVDNKIHKHAPDFTLTPKPQNLKHSQHLEGISLSCHRKFKHFCYEIEGLFMWICPLFTCTIERR